MLNAMVRSFIGQNKTAFLVLKNLAIIIIPVAYTYFLGFAMVTVEKKCFVLYFFSMLLSFTKHERVVKKVQFRQLM